MSRVIGILSGKGGVGKTTLTANLGAAISRLYSMPLLIDTNIKASSLGFHMGFYEDLPITLDDIIGDDLPLEHGIFIHPSLRVNFMPAPIDGSETDLNELDRLVSSLKKSYDVILLDIAPAFSQEAVESVRALDQAIVVSTPTIPAVADAMRTIKLLRKENKEVLGIVLNKTDAVDYEVSLEEIEKTCQVEVIGAVPRDQKVKKSIDNGVPVVKDYPFSKASLEIMRLASELIDVEWRPPGILDRLKSFFTPRKERAERTFLSKDYGIDREDGESEGFCCDECGRRFDTKRGLSIHQSKVH